jgi:hypothetical protein
MVRLLPMDEEVAAVWGAHRRAPTVLWYRSIAPPPCANLTRGLRDRARGSSVSPPIPAHSGGLSMQGRKTRFAALAAVAIAYALTALPVSADEYFGRIQVSSNRRNYHGHGCPIELIFVGNINFAPGHKGFSMNYSWERSDGAKGPVQVVHVQPGQKMLVVREPWKLGKPGEVYDASVTLHVNTGNTHLREASPRVHVQCK